MDVVLDPDFAHNWTIYLSYAHIPDDASTVRVLKATLDAAGTGLSNPRVMFEAQPFALELINYGGCLAREMMKCAPSL